ncbi:MAG: class I SAM-dependent methyltransferase [Lysobacterales bacterium]
MKIATDPINLACLEAEVYNRLLALDKKHILELGCGLAQKTRDIATSGVNRRITALEVDEVAHQNNLLINDLPNVEFGLAGAQDIPLSDESVDIVLMFKSLHHIPVELMEVSLQEIRRVLKPGGFLYISEPIFSGDFNEILSLFHNEQEVREEAFNTIKRAVDGKMFTLVEEVFFNTPRRYRDFAEFENTIINVSHTDHELDQNLFDKVKQMFEHHLGDDGALFLTPIRVDLLQKP